MFSSLKRMVVIAAVAFTLASFGTLPDDEVSDDDLDGGWFPGWAAIGSGATVSVAEMIFFRDLVWRGLIRPFGWGDALNRQAEWIERRSLRQLKEARDADSARIEAARMGQPSAPPDMDKVVADFERFAEIVRTYQDHLNSRAQLREEKKSVPRPSRDRVLLELEAEAFDLQVRVFAAAATLQRRAQAIDDPLPRVGDLNLWPVQVRENTKLGLMSMPVQFRVASERAASWDARALWSLNDAQQKELEATMQVWAQTVHAQCRSHFQNMLANGPRAQRVLKLKGQINRLLASTIKHSSTPVEFVPVVGAWAILTSVHVVVVQQVIEHWQQQNNRVHPVQGR